MTEPEQPVRDSTTIGRYHIVVTEHVGGRFDGLFAVDVYDRDRHTEGPYRYAHLNQALMLRDNLAETLRARVQQDTP